MGLPRWKISYGVNCNFFFTNKPINQGKEVLTVDSYRKRTSKVNWKFCPEAFYQKLEIRKYSLNTARVYIAMFERFINFYPAIDNPMNLSESEVKCYLQSLVQQNKSDSYINQSINSIKFYYEVVKEMPNRFYDIERPIRKEKLPEVISKGEVQAMIKCTKNLKHKCIISLLYSTGMRRGELLNLKITDIDSKRMNIFIRNGKGGKDRYTLLGEIMLKDLRTYYVAFEPSIWLFEGVKGKKYSGSSVENVVKDAAKKAGIRKRVTPHTLRHCFGTHSLESDINLRHIQTLMGHQTSRTTEIYTHVATSSLLGIKNLLD